MKKLILLLVSFIAMNSQAYVSTTQIKTWDKEICEKQNSHTVIKLLNQALEEAQLPLVEKVNCEIIGKTKVFKKYIVEMSFSFLDGVEEYCKNGKYDKDVEVVIEGAFLPNLDYSDYAKIFNDFNFDSLKSYFRATGVGYGEYHYFLPACSLKLHDAIE